MKKNSLFCLMGALLVMFPQLSDAQGNPQAAKLAREGAEAAKNKDWDKAVDLFQQAAQIDQRQAGNLAAALQQRGAAYFAQHKYPQAVADFTEALSIKDDPDTHLRRGYVEIQLQDYDSALADYSEVIKHHPGDPQYYLTRSYIYELKGDAANAIADCDKVLQMQPNNAEAKARKQRMQTLQAQQAATQMPPGPIPAPSQPGPPKKP